MPLFISSRFTNTTHNTTAPHLHPPPPPSSTTPPGIDPKTKVQSKDVTINATIGVAARLYLPPAADKGSKLPLLIYIHGGVFCVCTPFNPAYHNHLNAVFAAANVVVVLVHYRLAPEAPISACYDDSWEVVKWAASHASAGGPEPWLNDHADLGVVFFAEDSAGGNIAHNMKDELVAYLYPTYEGPTNLMIHSTMDPKISNLGCPRVLIFVSEKDFLRDRGCAYHDTLTKNGWNGKVDIVEFAGEDHVFHLFAPTKDNSFCSAYMAFPGFPRLSPAFPSFLRCSAKIEPCLSPAFPRFSFLAFPLKQTQLTPPFPSAATVNPRKQTEAK
ncbi:hypothetical protein Fmac_007539 [Flemingia macrophylla]|uniref:Alpha/beta hydrolase fold-3 domain-containing protein n=1 Tax=Flemingia macrophylla TaxID=520843 RepID=A0ABD1MUX1_9FABA